MLQIIVKVASLQNGSRKAVSGTGSTSMSDSLIACQPRMDEPSKPRPSSKTASSRASAGIVKCCHRPGKSMKRSEEHTSELQSLTNLVCRLLLEKKKKKRKNI